MSFKKLLSICLFRSIIIMFIIIRKGIGFQQKRTEISTLERSRRYEKYQSSNFMLKRLHKIMIFKKKPKLIRNMCCLSS